MDAPTASDAPTLPPARGTRAPLVAVGLLALGLALKVGVASRFGILSDEAYYWLWSQSPALGYFDHPPLLAWMIALTTLPGDSALLVRLGAILCGLAPLALLPAVRHRLLFVALTLGLLPIAWLTLLATPDAPLIATWSLCLAAALRDTPRAWAAAGLFGGLAILAKLTGILVLPLCLLATGAWRRPAGWLAMGIAGAVATPWLAWEVAQGLPSIGFQMDHGLGGTGLSPGPLLGYLGGQLALIGPLLLVPALVFWATAWRAAGAQRTLWLLSLGPIVLFGLASLRTAGEANWTAPAFIGLAAGLASTPSRILRALSWAGAGLGMATSLVLVAHLERPILPLDPDPRDRFHEGPALGRALEAHPSEAVLFTERYHEAALAAFYTDLRTHKHPVCGRPDQFERWPMPAVDAARYLRPARSGASTCIDPAFAMVERLSVLQGRDATGRSVARWDLFAVSERRTSGDHLSDRPTSQPSR